MVQSNVDRPLFAADAVVPWLRGVGLHGVPAVGWTVLRISPLLDTRENLAWSKSTAPDQHPWTETVLSGIFHLHGWTALKGN